MKKILVLEKVTKILEIVARKGQCSLSEVVDALKIQPSTAYNLLQNLVELQYLEKKNDSKKYGLGQKFIEIFAPFSKRKIIVSAAEGILTELAKEIQESVVLAIFHNNNRYVIGTAKYNQNLLDINFDLFEKVSCYETATGRVLLSYLPVHQLKKYVDEHGYPETKWNRISSLNSLIRETEKIRKTGLEIIKEKEVAAIAVPVFGPDKIVWAALGVYLPMTRFTSTKKDRIIRAMKNAAEKISQNLR